MYDEDGETLEQVEVVPALSLETFMVKLGRALSNLISVKMSPLIAGGFRLVVLKGPFQPRLFYNSVMKSLARNS